MIFIPFINSSKDFSVILNYYSITDIARIAIDNHTIIGSLPKNIKLWLDPAIDSLHSGEPDDDNFRHYIEDIKGYGSMIDKAFQQQPKKEIVEKFVNGILDKCFKYNASWLSVPQFPVDRYIRRNRINKMLAESSKDWASKNNFQGMLILPLILTHQEHSTKKTNRNKIIHAAVANLNTSKAKGIWIVDQSLDDLSGSDTLGRPKFPSLIKFHLELKDALSDNIKIIAGPYWGLNLILWARGLTSCAAIGLGRGYRYYLAGGSSNIRRASIKVAVSSLKRLANNNAQFKKWLNKAKNNPLIGAQAQLDLNNFFVNLDKYNVSDMAREQIAEFYRDWIYGLLEMPAAGRALALYQDFSNAYVIGKAISSPLPGIKGVSAKPEQVAKQFMLNCL